MKAKHAKVNAMMAVNYEGVLLHFCRCENLLKIVQALVFIFVVSQMTQIQTGKQAELQ